MRGEKFMEEKTEKILVATDGSKNSERAILEAKKYGECVVGEVTILTVMKPIAITYYGNISLSKIDNENIERSKQEILRKALEAFEDYPDGVSTKLRKGNPADEILEEAEEGAYDLIIIGSRGLGTFTRTILGSVSNKVLNHADTNVLIVK